MRISEGIAPPPTYIPFACLGEHLSSALLTNVHIQYSVVNY